VGAQESIEARPQGEGAPNIEAEPSSRIRRADPGDDCGPSSVRRKMAEEAEVSSSGSGSWRKYLNFLPEKGGDSPSEPFTDRAPALGEANSQMVAHPAPSANPIPTPSETKKRLGDFLSSFGNRRASSAFIQRTARELDLDNASPFFGAKIIQIMENLSQRRGQSGNNSGENAAANFTMKITDWEKRK